MRSNLGNSKLRHFRFFPPLTPSPSRTHTKRERENRPKCSLSEHHCLANFEQASAMYRQKNTMWCFKTPAYSEAMSFYGL